MRGKIIEFFIIKQIKKPGLVLCSVVKHSGSGRALKKWGKTLDCVSCFPLHFFRALPLPACFTTEHSTVEASLFVNYNTVKCPYRQCFFTYLPASTYHPMKFCRRKKMQSFLEVLKTFKFAAILLHHSHQSSLRFE